MLPLCTTGSILKRLREQGLADIGYGHVDYALKRAGVKPVGRAGFCRVFHASAAAKVESFIRERRQT